MSTTRGDRGYPYLPIALHLSRTPWDHVLWAWHALTRQRVDLTLLSLEPRTLYTPEQVFAQGVAAGYLGPEDRWFLLYCRYYGMWMGNPVVQVEGEVLVRAWAGHQWGFSRIYGLYQRIHTTLKFLPAGRH